MVAYSFAASATNDEADAWYDKIGKFAKYGAPGAIISAGASFVNTGIAFANVFREDDIEKWDTGEIIQESFAPFSNDYAAEAALYYSENQEVVDLAGLVAGSLIPGTLAVRGMRAFQAGAGTLRTAKAGQAVLKSKPWYTQGYRESPKLRALVKDIRNAKYSKFQDIGDQKIKAIVQGAGQQFLEAAAYEVATAFTMNQNSTWNKDDLGYFEALYETKRDVVTGTLFGGVIGSAFEVASSYGKIKKAVRETDRNILNQFRVTASNAVRDKQGNLTGLNFVGDELAREATSMKNLLNILRSPSDALDPQIRYLNIEGKKFDIFDDSGKLKTGIDETITNHIKILDARVAQDFKKATDGDLVLADQLHQVAVPKLEDPEFMSGFSYRANIKNVQDLAEDNLSMGHAQNLQGMRKASYLKNADLKHSEYSATRWSAGTLKRYTGIMPAELKAKQLAGKLKSADITPEVVDTMVKNAVGTIRTKKKIPVEHRRAAEKFLLTHGNAEQFGDLLDMAFISGKATPQTQQILASWKDLAVKQNPALRALDEDIKYSRQQLKLKDISAADAMDLYSRQVEKQLKLNKKLTNPEEMYSVLRAAEEAGEFVRGKVHQDLRQLVSNPYFRNQHMTVTTLMDIYGRRIIDKVNPTVADIPKALRGTVTKNGNEYFDLSVDYLNASKKAPKGEGVFVTSPENQLALDGWIFDNFKTTNLTEELRIKSPTYDAKLFTIPGVKEADKIRVNNLADALYVRTEYKFDSFKKMIQGTDETGELAFKNGETIEQMAIKLNVEPQDIDNFIKRLDGDSGEFTAGFYVHPQREGVRHAKVEYTRQGRLSDAELMSNEVMTQQDKIAKELNNAAASEAVSPFTGGLSYDDIMLKDAYGLRAEAAEAGEKLGAKANVAMKASSADSGAGFVSTGNTDYGSIGAMTSYVGKMVEKMTANARNLIDKRFAGIATTVVDDIEALSEIAIVEQKFRQDKFVDLAAFPEIADLLGDSIHYIPEKSFDDIGRLIQANAEDLESAMPAIRQLAKETGFAIKNVNAKSFFSTMREVNDEYFISGLQHLNFVQGKQLPIRKGTMYMGKFNTEAMNHFYAVELPDSMLGGNSTLKRTGFITAPTKELLEQKKAALLDLWRKNGGKGKEPSFVTKSDQDKFFQIRDEYNSSEAITDKFIDSSMGSKNKLFDFIPDPSPKAVSGLINSMKDQAQNIIRRSTAIKYAEELDSLAQMAQQFPDTTFGKTGKLDNPFQEQINTALNISNKQKYDWWINSQNAVVSAMDNAIGSIGGMFHSLSSGEGKVKSGVDKWEVFNQTLKEHGFPVIADPQQIQALSKAPTPVVEKFVAKVNGALASVMLRLDGAQSIVNTMSTPILLMPELKSLAKHLDAEKLAQIAAKNSVDHGNGVVVASNLKLMQQSVTDLWRQPELVRKYKDLNLTTSLLEDISDAAGDLGATIENAAKEGWRGNLSKVSDKIGQATDFLAKNVTMVDRSEHLVKFVAARSADLLIEDFVQAGLKISESQRNALLKSIVTKVHGNYSAAQRPAMFQGALGQAIGLFQTYQFNLIQRFFTHINAGQAGNAKQLLALQAGIFGTQSVPGFQMLNDYIASRTENGQDFYTETKDTLGAAGNVLLYGMGSHMVAPLAAIANKAYGVDMDYGIDFFNRGDLTPRTPVLIPTSLNEIPAVNMATKTFSGLGQLFSNVSNGAPIGASINNMLATQGLNRPLAGIAQLWQGQKTTSQGTSQYFYNNPLAMTNWVSTTAKALGTKSVDEAIALNSYYRATEMRADRYSKMEELGRTVKTTLRGGGDISESYERVLEQYSSAGGDMKSFKRWMGDQYANANESQIAQFARSNTKEGQYMYDVLDADFSNLYK